MCLQNVLFYVRFILVESYCKHLFSIEVSQYKTVKANIVNSLRYIYAFLVQPSVMAGCGFRPVVANGLPLCKCVSACVQVRERLCASV